MCNKILVIKLAALGDFVQAMGPFRAIRRHHATAHITLLTTEPFKEFAKACACFDEILLDCRPSRLQVTKWLDLRRQLRHAAFDRVYDLQTSDRSSCYYRLFWPGPYPQWSGIAKGCSHPHANARRDFMHTVERQAEQLKIAGIDNVPVAELSWIKADISRFAIKKPYALLVPGGAPGRPEKRWPYRRYLQITRQLAAKGIMPVLLGKGPEEDILQAIADKCPEALSLAGQTSFQEIVALAKNACWALGNDTGPMHLITAAQCSAVVLYSTASDPSLCGQRGQAVTIIRDDKIDDISVDEVMANIPDNALAGDA